MRLAVTELAFGQPDFWSRLETLVAWEEDAREEVETSVRAILADVRRRGDAALVEHTRRLDEREVSGPGDLVLDAAALACAHAALEPRLRDALATAAARIRTFHERQMERSWSYTEEVEPGGARTVLGQRIVPIERVGLYVPGGQAAYPSSVLMNAIPARVAGVRDVVMAVPAPRGRLNDAVLAAAVIAGVERVFTVGGAQAVGAMAFGTETVPRVDKIVGPGNAYVATAKRLVFGRVGIDMVAGPSEILVVADGSSPAEWTALDLFSQAEHDADARAWLVSTSRHHLERVRAAMQRLLPEMGRAATIAASLERHGALITVPGLDEALAVVDYVAPEHLELALADAEAVLPRVRNAGAVFVGSYACEALGDYCAGPNHVLPTGRTARFSSPLGVYDFQKRSNVVQCSPATAERLGEVASILARAEGLDAHARSAEARRRRDGEAARPGRGAEPTGGGGRGRP